MKMILWIVLPCLIIGATGCETSYNGPATDNYNFRHIPPAFWDNNSTGAQDAHAAPLLPSDRLYANQDPK
jgi:hypothetical protein